MVRELLEDLARDVPDYSDPGRALAAARAARRRRAGAGVVAALALLTFFVWTPLRGDPAPHAAQSGPTVPDLPAGAVGPARFVYRLACRQPCSEHVVVLGDGTRYSLDHLGDLGKPSLSPDGRLLAAPFGAAEVRVRDLGRAEPPRSFDGSLDPNRWEPLAWSPDSRYLVLWGPRGIGATEYARIDLTTGTTVTYQPLGHRFVIAVLPGGELLLAPSGWSVALDLEIVDPATGASRPVPASDLRPWMAQKETVRHSPADPAMISSDGNRLGVVVRTMEQEAVALLEINLINGAKGGRHELGLVPGWIPVTYTENGMIAVARNPTRAAIYRPGDATIVEFADLPRSPGLSVLVRGGHGWY